MTQYLACPDGARIAYEHSPGGQPGVLFCAGFNSDMQGIKAVALEAWCRQRNIQFTRFDYFGHGESSGDFKLGTIGRWRDDTLRILDHVTRGPQLLVGSSMGGWIMLLVAQLRSERLCGLVGIAAAPDFTQRLRAQRLSQGQLQQLEDSGYCDMPNSYDDGVPYTISRQLLEEGEAHLLLGSRIGIKMPVRLLHGQADEDVHWEHALMIAQQLESRDVEIQLVKDGDHRLSEPLDIQRLLDTVEKLLAQAR